MNERIYRCSDGHLYSASAGKAIVFSLHFGLGTHLQQCPVDHRWRMARLVDQNELSEEQLAEARRNRF